MPPALTVTTVRTTERSRVDALVSSTQTQLADTDTALTAARTDLAAKTDQSAVAQQAEAGLRRQIAAALMPAEAHKLELDLEANLLAQRPLLAALAAAQDQVATTARARQRVSAALDRARAQLARADADLKLADQEDKYAEKWRAALTGTALHDVVATAGNATTTDSVTAARNRLAMLLGDNALVDLLDKRLAEAMNAADERAAAISRAADALDTLRAELSPLDGKVSLTGDAFSRTREEVRAVVELGAQRLSAALSVLQLVAAAPDQTAAEQERINARAVDARTGTPSPVSKEQDLLDATVTLRTANAALEAKALIEEAKNPAFDRDTDPALAAERTARDDAQATLDQKTNDFTAADKAAIDSWEVAVPPATLTAAIDGLRAVAAVAALKSVNLDQGGAGLLERLDSAEEAYAGALTAQIEANVRQEAAGALVTERLDAQAAVAPVADLRLVAAVRGDQ